MRRITLIAASIIAVLVIAYAGWLSSATSGGSGGGGDDTSQTDQPGRGENDVDGGGKPGEAPKD